MYWSIYFCFTFVYSIITEQNLILIPKKEYSSFINIAKFADEHNLVPFAKIDDLTFYKVTKQQYLLFENTLNQIFNVEREQEYKITNEMSTTRSLNAFKDTEFSSLPWHLGRVAKRNLPLDISYKYDSKGSCHQNKDIEIDTYIIDTGIDVTHPEFEGRATWLSNFIDAKNTDCHSHGTHCAGLVGSKSYGVCKDARLFAIKVLDCYGSGSTSSVIAGISDAYKRHLLKKAKSGGKVRSIVSMSLGGGFSKALNLAVKNTLKDPHFYFAAAAGNENADSCETSPASVKEIFTVMASDKYDERAYFSNWGKCADLYSPGVDIISTIPNDKTAVYSGTSMSTPIFVGAMNHYIDQYSNLNMKKLKNKILNEGGQDLISNNPLDTNNILIYLNRQ